MFSESINHCETGSSRDILVVGPALGVSNGLGSRVDSPNRFGLLNQCGKRKLYDWDSGPNRPFAHLADRTLEHLESLNDQCKSVVGELSGSQMDSGLDHNVMSNNGKFQLWAKQTKLCVDGEHRATCRMVLIQGQKNEILNTWIFPTTPEHTPVFAAELIAMAGLPRLTFIDIQSPAMKSGSDLVRKLTLGLRTRHIELVCAEEPPEWAVSASEGGYVFSRALTAAAFEQIDACYQDYLSCFLREFISKNDFAGDSEVSFQSAAQSELSQYQVHHMEHSPGSVFLGKLFGDEWTNHFLRNFLFTSA